MGLTNLLSDIYTSLTFTEVQAESEAHQSADVEQTVRRGPEYGDKTETGGDDDNDKGGDDGSGGDADGDKAGEEAEADGGEGGAAAEDDDDAGGAEDGEEAAEEEEEDDEPVDPKPKLEEGMFWVFVFTKPLRWAGLFRARLMLFSHGGFQSAQRLRDVRRTRIITMSVSRGSWSRRNVLLLGTRRARGRIVWRSVSSACPPF